MKLPTLFSDLGDTEREYFLRLARKHERELAFHEIPGGLWEKDMQGKDWSNVTEHCLIEAARVGMLARFLHLPEGVRGHLVSAAVVHDFDKKEDDRCTREDIAAGGSGRRGNLIAQEKSEEVLRVAGFPALIISLVGCVSADPKDVRRMKSILDLTNPSSEDLAHLVMHYVDNYTRGGAWVELAGEWNGKVENDIDRRNRMNASNPAYERMNREGLKLNEKHPLFRGMTRFESAATVNHLIEARFAAIMREHGVDIGDPLNLPEFIDARLREEISKESAPT